MNKVLLLFYVANQTSQLPHRVHCETETVEFPENTCPSIALGRKTIIVLPQTDYNIKVLAKNLFNLVLSSFFPINFQPVLFVKTSSVLLQI